MRVAIIGACYYTSPSQFSKVTSEFVDNLLLDHAAASKCFVSMRPSVPLPVEPGDKASWIHSTGKYLDISAYASAASVVGDHDLYLILNDTLFAKHPWRMMARRLGALVPSLTAIREPAAAGEVHPSTDLLLLDVRNPTRRHLSTFCFLLNRAGFDVFQQLARTLPGDDSNLSVRRWLDDHADQHVALKHMLHVHLTGPVSPWSWKGRVNGNVAEDLLLRKAVTVAFEYLFSEQVLRRGGLVMPMNIGLKYRVCAKAAALYSRIGRP
ncbi:hypothetical protein [Cupriavidus sp. CP313]